MISRIERARVALRALRPPPFERRTILVTLATAGALALALIAQSLIEHGPDAPWDGPILYLMAIAAWLFAVHAQPSLGDVFGGRERGLEPRPGPRIVPDKRARVRLAVGLGLVAFTTVLWPWIVGRDGGGLAIISYVAGHENPENAYAPAGVLLWLAGIAAYLSAVLGVPRLPSFATWLAERLAAARARGGWWLAGFAAIGAAAWFRFHGLADLPGQMTSDHVEKLMDLHDLVNNGQYRSYFPRNTGREPFQFYWTALFSWVLGMPVAFLTLKTAMATLSLVGVAATWRFARRIGGELVGVCAAWVMALAPWDVQITRVALRYELGSVFTALCLWALSRALVRGRRGDWLLAAAVTALGLHGYTSFRAVGLLLPVFAGTWWIAAWLQRKRTRHSATDPIRSMAASDSETEGGMTSSHAFAETTAESEESAQPARAAFASVPIVAGHVTAAAGLGLLLIAPMMRFAWDHPDVFWSRVVSRTTSAEAAITEPLTQFAQNAWNAVRMVNWTTDSAFLISPPNRTALEPVGAALFVLGLVTAILWVGRRDPRIAATLAAWPIMLAPSMLALAFPNEVPHLARASGALPITAVIAALPAPIIVRRLRETLGLAGVGVALVLALGLSAWMATNTYDRYFNQYAESYAGSTHPTDNAAAVIQAFEVLGGRIENVYMIGWPNGWDYRALGVLAGDPYWNGLIGGRDPDWYDAVRVDAAALAENGTRKLFFVGGEEAERFLEGLRAIYPDALVTRHPVEPEDRSFYSVVTP